MKIRRKTRKRGGGPREKLVAWINYVLEYAHGHGWEKFPMIESQTSKNGKIVKTVVEVEASETIYKPDFRSYIFPSTKKSMDKKYASGLAMHLWNPQRGTGTNYDLYRRFESQYHNDSNIESLYGNESVSRSHSPVRGRNIRQLGLQFGQQLNEVQEQLHASLASSSAASAASSIQPARAPIANRGANNNARIQALALKLHTEQSEARELKELQQKLSEAAMPKWLIDRWSLNKDDVNYKFIKQIMKAGEVILYLVINQYDRLLNPIARGNELAEISDGGEWCLSLVITNKNVYSIRMNKNSYKKYRGNGGTIISGLYYMRVYTFDAPLNLKQLKILSFLSSKSEYRNPGITESVTHDTRSILDKLQNNNFPGNFVASHVVNYVAEKVNCLQAQKELESVIRLIPGSYKNENWRPMDGFFGLYVNPSTMEINEFPGTELE